MSCMLPHPNRNAPNLLEQLVFSNVCVPAATHNPRDYRIGEEHFKYFEVIEDTDFIVSAVVWINLFLTLAVADVGNQFGPAVDTGDSAVWAPLLVLDGEFCPRVSDELGTIFIGAGDERRWERGRDPDKESREEDRKRMHLVKKR